MSHAPAAAEQAPPSAEERVARLQREVDALQARLDSALHQVHDLQSTLDQSFAQANYMAMKAELASAELRQLVKGSHDASWVVDNEFVVRRVNEQLLKLLGRQSDEVLGRHCHEVFDYGLCHSDRCPLKLLGHADDGATLELDVESKGLAEAHAFIANVSPFIGIDGEAEGIVGSFKDITDRKRAEASLQAANKDLELLAVVDGLTQVANRRKFDATLTAEWLRGAREQAPLSVVLCDVDHFKLYNDNYGHQGGDECLRRIAAALKGQVRRPGDLVARYGGEEFVVLLPNTPLEGALQVAEAMRAAVAALGIPHAHSSAASHVTLSLGVAAMLPGAPRQAQALVEHADQALYAAKRSGRNRANAAA